MTLTKNDWTDWLISTKHSTGRKQKWRKGREGTVWQKCVQQEVFSDREVRREAEIAFTTSLVWAAPKEWMPILVAKPHIIHEGVAWWERHEQQKFNASSHVSIHTQLWSRYTKLINFNITYGANVLKIALGVCSRMISILDLSSKGADDVITSRYGRVWHEAWSTNTCLSECSNIHIISCQVLSNERHLPTTTQWTTQHQSTSPNVITFFEDQKS